MPITFEGFKIIKSKNLKGKDVNLEFLANEEIELRVAYSRGSYEVAVSMPWNHVFYLGDYNTKKEAEEAYDKFSSYLEKGYPLRIKDSCYAEILVPKADPIETEVEQK